jgi:hypothetical protein
MEQIVHPDQLWDEALSLETYVGQMWRKNRKMFARNRERTVIDSPLRNRFAQHAVRILVLTEHYCEDSLQLVPIIWRLADDLDNVDVRVLRQHQYPDLAARYLTNGHPAIPVFIVLNEHGQEPGALIERPTRVTNEITEEIRRFQQAHSELPGIQRALDRMPEKTRAAVKQHVADWRDDQSARWAEYLLEDLAALVGG